MSAIRYSAPGQPTRLVVIDDGAHPVRPWSTGGSLVGFASPMTRVVSPKRAAAHERYRLGHVLVCGRVMPRSRSTCARKPDHKDACRTSTWMRGQAMGRRTT